MVTLVQRAYENVRIICSIFCPCCLEASIFVCQAPEEMHKLWVPHLKCMLTLPDLIPMYVYKCLLRALATGLVVSKKSGIGNRELAPFFGK